MTAPVSTGTGAVVLKIRIFQERRLFMVKSKTMTTESTITTTEQITYDSDMMSAELDKIKLPDYKGHSQISHLFSYRYRSFFCFCTTQR